MVYVDGIGEIRGGDTIKITYYDFDRENVIDRIEYYKIWSNGAFWNAFQFSVQVLLTSEGPGQDSSPYPKIRIKNIDIVRSRYNDNWFVNDGTDNRVDFYKTSSGAVLH
jgi:hypothetical protein